MAGRTEKLPDFLIPTIVIECGAKDAGELALIATARVALAGRW